MARTWRALGGFKLSDTTQTHGGDVIRPAVTFTLAPAIARGRLAFISAPLLTVSGFVLMLCAFLLDRTLFLQLTHSIKEPFHTSAQRLYSLAQLTFPMATETSQKPPTKKELGNAGWTLIHSIAANYPEAPSEQDQYHARAFLRSIGKLYPCKRCRQHFDKYLTTTPPDLSSREQFMLWACGAHNAVNKRNGKTEFPCRMKKLEHRWGDCGCQLKK